MSIFYSHTLLDKRHKCIRHLLKCKTIYLDLGSSKTFPKCLSSIILFNLYTFFADDYTSTLNIIEKNIHVINLSSL